MGTTAVMGQQGCLVIPVELRDALDLRPGDELHITVEEGRLVVQKPAAPAQTLRGSLAGLHAERSLVDELLAERRAEAQHG
ncbi:AbrB/MazE/SpoVT family DNA-binding domain-containing protein [Klenkia sp. PcliD-1-E]|uniref:AbrB/MazE/SpoVT family DNA-binding domain-containing protein n=1 Tax=Klenkia sp. PcliD-1-E TaxID=2954492 RepID=UPI002096DE65|nr:AbrB/MazE/SpoVT family DNA-binding domain-containing protein [Klenkia sp. PcliD-1-E]MCO7219970.1 AbrB/MazE/SpoVT family DNA-binding domain-containing protein [Klenkia sp. PcliD-1-E]